MRTKEGQKIDSEDNNESPTFELFFRKKIFDARRSKIQYTQKNRLSTLPKEFKIFQNLDFVNFSLHVF